MKFSEKIKNLRIAAEITQQELSKHLGISASAIGYLENEQRDPTGSTLISYAKFFNVSIDSLVGLEPDIEDSIFIARKANYSTSSQNNSTIRSTDNGLTPEEKSLLETYRALNTKNKMHVSAYAEIRLEEQKEFSPKKKA